MKKVILRSGILFLMCVIVFPLDAHAGNDRDSGVAVEFQKIGELIADFTGELNRIPPDIGQIAVLELEDPDSQINRYSKEMIHNRIEQAISNSAGLRAVVLPRNYNDAGFELNIETQNDQLVINNVSTAEYDNENDRLLYLAQEYNIDAYLLGSLHYVDDEFILHLNMFRPRSREVIWNETITSSDFVIRDPTDTKFGFITTGTSLQSLNTYSVNESAFTRDIRLVDYSMAFGVRRPINSGNSSFLGITGGFHYMTLIETDDNGANFDTYSTVFGKVGFRFYQAIAEKRVSVKDHWLDLFFGGSMYIPISPHNLFSLTQGINLNFTSNLGIMLKVDYIVSENPIIRSDRENKTLELNNLNYGLHVLFRF